MAFKRIAGMGEGNYIVEIMKSSVIDYTGNKQALQITVRTIQGSEIYHNFLIFTNNIHIIDKLINITYEENLDEEVNEEDFVGVCMEITTKEKNGYINIIDINSFEVE